MQVQQSGIIIPSELRDGGCTFMLTRHYSLMSVEIMNPPLPLIITEREQNKP